MKIYLIRHGETTADLEGRYGGDYDDELTDKGKSQAEELAIKLASKGIECIYHSPKIRAVQTTQILNTQLHCVIEEVQDLRERNGYGVLTGLTKVEAKEKYPEEFEQFTKEGYGYHIKGSEDVESLRERVISAFNSIVDNKTYNKVAVVTHGGVIRTFMRSYIKLCELKKLEDCAVFEIDVIDGNIVLVSMDKAELVNASKVEV